MLRFSKTSNIAQDLTRSSPEAAGLDLKSAHACTVPARGAVAVSTDLVLALPHNTYGRVCSRSGLAFKHDIEVGAGIIDSDYRGVVVVLLRNHGTQDYTVAEGERIAQLIVHPYIPCSVREVPFAELDTTERGNNGFGSTGKH